MYMRQQLSPCRPYFFVCSFMIHDPKFQFHTCNAWATSKLLRWHSEKACTQESLGTPQSLRDALIPVLSLVIVHKRHVHRCSTTLYGVQCRARKGPTCGRAAASCRARFTTVFAATANSTSNTLNKYVHTYHILVLRDA